MRTVLLFVLALPLAAGTIPGGPCIDGTWADLIALGSTGCVDPLDPNIVLHDFHYASPTNPADATQVLFRSIEYYVPVGEPRLNLHYIVFFSQIAAYPSIDVEYSWMVSYSNVIWPWYIDRSAGMSWGTGGGALGPPIHAGGGWITPPELYFNGALIGPGTTDLITDDINANSYLHGTGASVAPTLRVISNNPPVNGWLEFQGNVDLGFHVPEPATVALCGFGCVLLAAGRFRRNTKA